MSAFMVETDTIDLIVSVLVEWRPKHGEVDQRLFTYGRGPLDPELAQYTTEHDGYHVTSLGGFLLADALGRELIDANVASLGARYSHSDGGADMIDAYAESYTWRKVLRDGVGVPRAMGAIQCYEYQACESGDWGGMFAHELSKAAMKRLVGMVSEGWDYSRTELADAYRAKLAAAK